MSSELDDLAECGQIACADPRDVIDGSFSEYPSGEVGNFIFGTGDLNQFIVVDLGQTRRLDLVAVTFSDGTSDREVFDFVEISTSLDGVVFEQRGIVGIPGVGDPLDFTLVSPVFFQIVPGLDARFVRYNFGRHFPDFDGGLRIFAVFAVGVP